MNIPATRHLITITIAFSPLYTHAQEGQPAPAAPPKVEAPVVKKPKTAAELWQLTLYHNDPYLSGRDIPKFPDYYQWQITDSIGGQKVIESNIPAFRYDMRTESITPVGTIAVGTKLDKLTNFVLYRGRIYFEVNKQFIQLNKPNLKDAVFIMGDFITRIDAESFRLPKGLSRRHGLTRAETKAALQGLAQ